MLVKVQIKPLQLDVKLATGGWFGGGLATADHAGCVSPAESLVRRVRPVAR